MPRAGARSIAATVLVGVVVALTACTGGGPEVRAGILTIFAPPSMTEAVGGMTQAYSGTYPGVGFETLFEPDSLLAQRVADGATPDILLAEDPTTLATAGVTATPAHFARGQLVMAVAAANPAPPSALADVARRGLRVALCARDEPCGRVAEAVLAAAQVTLPGGAIREADVRSALRHVTDGSADVALVYRSDALAAGEAVRMVEMPESVAALADLVAVVPDGAPLPDVARNFLDYLTSTPVMDALTRDGFRPPA